MKSLAIDVVAVYSHGFLRPSSLQKWAASAASGDLTCDIAFPEPKPSATGRARDRLRRNCPTSLLFRQRPFSMPPRLAHKKSRRGCQRCKARKVKCDELQPNCSACQRHGVPCTYTRATPRTLSGGNG